MIYFFDTYYKENAQALTAVVGIEDWQQEASTMSFLDTTEDVNDYESGAFYKRELPCILAALQKITLQKNDVIVVDGYVYLSDEHDMGLGAYLYDALDKSIPIIGVAKNNFQKINTLKREVYRGKSIKPLYITAVGYDLEDAAIQIKDMHGIHRMPTILKLVDALSRT